MKKRKEATFGPELTDRQKEDLLDEISNFNSVKAKRDIEEASEHREAIEYETFDDVTVMRDVSDEEVLKPTALDKEVEIGKIEIDEILSHRQRQVWRLCMRQGLSHEEAAEKLNIGTRRVTSYLKTATKKVEDHFNALNGRNRNA